MFFYMLERVGDKQVDTVIFAKNVLFNSEHTLCKRKFSGEVRKFHKCNLKLSVPCHCSF